MVFLLIRRCSIKIGSSVPSDCSCLLRLPIVSTMLRERAFSLYRSAVSIWTSLVDSDVEWAFSESRAVPEKEKSKKCIKR